MSNSSTKDKSSQYFKTFMRFRKQTIVEISEHTGISKRTIQGYAQGRPPFCKAPAVNFLAITDYMEIDPRYMLGREEWKISEYLENICKEYNLESLSDVAKLPNPVRLTERTQKYRSRKKKRRKLANSDGKCRESICKKIVVESPNNATFWEIGNKKSIDVEFTDNKPGKIMWDVTIELVHEYIELFKEIESSSK